MTTAVHPPRLSRYLMALLATWILGTWLNYIFCCKPKVTASQSVTPVIHANTPASVPEVENFSVVIDDDSVSLDLVESPNFQFKNNSFVFEQPVDDALNTNLNTLQSFLSKHPNHRLILSGGYLLDEKNTSALPNLGLARANTVKSYMVQQGLPAKQLIIDAGILSDNAVVEGKLVRALDVTLEEMPAAAQINEDAELVTFGVEIREEPLVLEFGLGESYIKLNDYERDVIFGLVRFLDRNEGSKLHVIGHTDNQGSKENNLKLGQSRAEFAADYFQKNGLDRERMVITSKGESEPVASNDDETGRARNRRTVVTLY